MADQQKVVNDLSNGTIFKDLEQLTLTPSFKVTPFLMLNVSETVRYTDTDSMEY